MFGEEILFSDSRRSFSAQATEPTRACACYKADFEGLIAQNSNISKKVIQALGQKLNSMAKHLADVAIYDTRRRVARTLARLAKDYGDPTDEGRRLNFRLTHAELGALVGASRVMVTNVLKSLGDEGSVYSDERAHRFVVSRELLAVAEAEAPEEVPPPPEPPCACYREPF
jgi:CRP/FNR family cyclic AMP-dependent transcriptional regulator